MSNFRIIVVALFLGIFVTTASYAAEPAKPKAAESKKELTKADIIEHIKGNLDRFGEILNSIPGLKKETDATGKAIYTYQGKSLADMDKDQLMKLYRRVNAQVVLIRTERINKQLETIRRAEQAARRAQQASRPIVIPSQPPTVCIPPQVPSSAQPAAITQQPRVPAPPPAPPKK